MLLTSFQVMLLPSKYYQKVAEYAAVLGHDKIDLPKLRQLAFKGV